MDKNSEIHLNQNILIDTSQNFELNEKFMSSVPEVFKGFPPNEISTIHNHVNYMYDTLNYNIPFKNFSQYLLIDTKMIQKNYYFIFYFFYNFLQF